MASAASNGSARGAHIESMQCATAFSPLATDTSTGRSRVRVASYTTVRGSTRTIGTRPLPRALGQAPHVGGLRPRVGRGHGDDRQPGRQGHRLGHAGRRAAADADEQVGAGVGRGRPGPLRDLDRHVHHHLVVPPGDGQAGRDRAGGRRRGPARDHHHPLGPELGHLGGQAPLRRRPERSGPAAGACRARTARGPPAGWGCEAREGRRRRRTGGDDLEAADYARPRGVRRARCTRAPCSRAGLRRPGRRAERCRRRRRNGRLPEPSGRRHRRGHGPRHRRAGRSAEQPPRRPSPDGCDWRRRPPARWRSRTRRGRARGARRRSGRVGPAGPSRRRSWRRGPR